jgi:hypothetical protein
MEVQSSDFAMKPMWLTMSPVTEPVDRGHVGACGFLVPKVGRCCKYLGQNGDVFWRVPVLMIYLKYLKFSLK